MTRGGVENTRLEAKDIKKFRGQGQTLLRPRPRTKDTDASVLQKKGLQKIFFRRSLFEETKKRSLQIFRKVFQRNFNYSKIVLSSSRGQGNFRGLEASRPRPRTSKCVLEAKDFLKDSTSDYDMKQNVKTFFFKEQLFWFLEHTQDFEVTVSGATRVKGLKPH